MPLARLTEPYGDELAAIAESILAHRFPLLGHTIETGPEIRWRRDYVSGIETPARYFRFIPYLDRQRAGDHKIVWELNRHQHWVILAQAYLRTRRQALLDEIERQFSSWVAQNPYLRGINWTSALEVAFRALSWIWVLNLAGGELERGFAERLVAELYRHGAYLERNLSVYFSPNTHLLGEAVALHALGKLFAKRRWVERGGRLVLEQMKRQVRPDGSHFEQSSYYHGYALDMFRFHAALERTPAWYGERLERIEAYLADLMGPSRRLPLIGDDDGGRFLGAREVVHEGGRESRFYPDAGMAVMVSSGVHVLVDAGPFGPGSAGHSHSDTLSVVVRAGDEDVLIDPGTYTYVGDPTWRDRFRGSAMHNTVRIGGRDQAVPAGPFRWAGRPRVEVCEWRTGPDQDFLDAVCTYAGFRHRRRVTFFKPDRLEIVDEVEGGPAEQFWHPGAEVRRFGPGEFAIGARARLVCSAAAEWEEGGEFGWRSTAFGTKEPAPVIRVRFQERQETILRL